MSSAITGGNQNKKRTEIIIGVTVAIFVGIVLLAVGIGIGVYFYNKNKNEPKNVTFDQYEKWTGVSSTGSPQDAGTPPSISYGSISLYIKGEDLTNGNWKPAVSNSKDQLITNISPGTYTNTSVSTTYSFTLDVFFDSGTVTVPSTSGFDKTKENAEYLIGYTTYNRGDQPPSNGRPDYGANSLRFPIDEIVFDESIPFSGLSGSFKDVLLKPNQILNISLNILSISKDPNTTDIPNILQDVVFNISSGSITKLK